MNNLANFISHVINDCQSQGIVVILSPTSNIAKFDEYKRKLIVSIDNPLDIWLSNLVHEYAHFEQFIHKIPLYTRIRVDIDTWLRLNRKHDKTLLKIRDMELDCERRSLKIIDRFKLPLNKIQYCKRASSYIHYYNYMLLNPIWCKIPPYQIDEIYENMPCTLRGKYYKLGRFTKLYQKYYD